MLTVITISVRVGRCLADGYFGESSVNEIVTVKCSVQGSYVGKQKRSCILGKEDGEWQEIKGKCISIGLVILCIVLVVIIVAVVIFLIFSRMTKKPGDAKNRGNRKMPITKPQPNRSELPVIMNPNYKEEGTCKPQSNI